VASNDDGAKAAADEVAQEEAARGFDDMAGNYEVVTLTGGKGTLRLRPLTRKMLRAMQRDIREGRLDPEDVDHRMVTLAANRGGYKGTEDDLDELLELDDIVLCQEAMSKLSPLTEARGKQILARDSTEGSGTKPIGG
jgi:hypothetical protein